jgi:uncharacterized protein YdaU (DUF1376 family)
MPSDKLPMLPWFPRDFMSSTRGWKLAERGLYRELLDAQWELGALPANLNDLADITGARRREFASAWVRVKAKFVSNGNGGLINLKLEEHRQDALRRIRDFSNAGRLGGLRAAEQRRASNAQATPQHRHSDATASLQPPSPSPSPSEEVLQNLDISHSVVNTSGTRKKARADVGYRIPEPFLLTSTMQKWAVQHAPHVDVLKATEEFADFWRTVPGGRGRKLNWELTWKNRMRECEGRALTSPSRSSPVQETKFERLTRALDHDG